MNKENCKLILVARDFSKVDFDEKHIRIEADLTSMNGIKKLKERISKENIDVLINMAGIGIYKPLEDLSLEDFYLSQQLNLMVPFLLIKTVLDDLKKSDIGLILNIGSGAGTMPFVERSAYCASKYGLRGLSLSLSEEYKGRKPSFCLITLGSTLTTFGGKSIEKQKEKIKNGNAIFPVDYVVKKLIKIIKDEGRDHEVVLFPSEYGFGKWEK